MAKQPISSNSSMLHPAMNDEMKTLQLESRVDRLEIDVTSIGDGVKKLLDRPQNPGLSQIITTIVSALAVLSIICGFAEWRLSTAIDPVQSEIAQVRHAMEKMDDAFRTLQIDSARNRAK